MTRRLMVVRLLSARRRQATTLLCTSGVLAMVFVAMVLIPASSTQAVYDSIVAGTAGHTYAVQVAEPAGVDAVSSDPRLVPLWSSSSPVSTGSREVSVNIVRTSSNEVTPGMLVKGTHPTGHGEATLPERLAATLDVDIGDHLTLMEDGQTGQLRITGLTVDPADRTTASLVVLDSGADPTEANVWLTTIDPWADPALGPLLDQRILNARTIETLAAEQGELNAAVVFKGWPLVLATFGVISVCLLLGLFTVLGRAVKPDVRALQAAGMTSSAAWRLVIAAGGICLLSGVAAGASISTVLGHVFRSSVSRPLGQDWQGITLQWGALLWFCVGIPLVVCGIALTATRISWTRPLFFGSRSRLVIAAAFGCLVAVTALGHVSIGLTAVTPVIFLFVSIIVAWLTRRVVTIGARRATRKLIGSVSPSLVALAVSACILVYAFGWYAAASMHNSLATQSAATPVQPAGSLLISGITDDAAQSIAGTFEEAGGTEIVHYALPVEAELDVRVTSPGLITCVRNGNHQSFFEIMESACLPDHASVPVNIVALDDKLSTDNGVIADLNLVESGQVGLLEIAVETGEIIREETVPTSTDPLLGGNMPGAVITSGSDLANRLGLQPSGVGLLALVDFGVLSEAERAEMRATVTRVASTAQVAEDLGFVSVGRQRAMANAVAIAGSVIVVLVLSTAGLAFVAGQYSVRRLMRDIGLKRGRLRLVAARLMAIPAVAIGVALVMARAAAWVSGAHDGSGFGWIWILPGTAGLVVCAGVAVAYTRAPAPQ